MATLPQRVCLQEPGRRLVRLAVLLAAITGGGCANRSYRAAHLPAELVAPVTENVGAVDLSRLANYSTGSEWIDRGDVLEVTIVTDFSKLNTTTTPVRVSENGTANVPLIGEVAVAGLDLEGAEQAIAAAGKARGVFQRPHVTVTMKRQRMNKITVIGAVKEPGVYEIPRGSSCLLAALVEAGGLAEDAGGDVEIRKPLPPVPGPLWQPPAPRVAGPDHAGRAELTAYEAPPDGPTAAEITRVNLVAAAAEGNGGHYLDDGGVVMVAKRAPKPVYVIGLVRKPGEFELPPNQNLHLLDAVALAGERTMQVADKVIVIRRLPGQDEPIVIQASIREAKHNGEANVRLAPGDIVSVEETPATMVLETLQAFIRFGISSTIPMF